MLQDATSTAQFLYDATLNGPGGRARPRPALPTVHPALLKLGMKRPDDWSPGEGFYTVVPDGEDPPALLCNECHGEGRAEGGPFPWCGTNRTAGDGPGRGGLQRVDVAGFLAARRGATALSPRCPARESGPGAAFSDVGGRDQARVAGEGTGVDDGFDEDDGPPRPARAKPAPRAADLEGRLEALLRFVARSRNAAVLEAIRPRMEDLEDAQVGALVLDRVLRNQEALLATHQLREALELDI